MVVTDSENLSQGEVKSSIKSDQEENKSHVFSPLGRQSSIYSLTLDEFQHTLCDGGKNFGSMNMDEFLNSIWTAEENQAQAQVQGATNFSTNNNNNAQNSLGGSSATENRNIARQQSLQRQGSLTIPAPLSRKTVEEVWSEIHKTEQEQHQNNNVRNHSTTQRQPTFGEMTLEDFLVRAGVVQEQCNPPPPPQQPYGLFQNTNNPAVGSNILTRPIMGLRGLGDGDGISNIPAYQPQIRVGEASVYPGNGKRSSGTGGYQQQPPAVYGGVVGNGGGGGGGGYGQVPGLGIGSPVSPVSSDGVCAGPIDGVNQYGMDMSGMRGGRKRLIDGPVERVVERRQRRMIKNRESAARSRARKQAYTVELEAELNQLREENAHLKLALVIMEILSAAALERQRKQAHLEEAKMKPQTKAQKAKEKLGMIRRTLSCPY